jgi:hypothetical protein
MTTAKASRSHDATMVEMLKSDPEFANEYLAAALDEADEPGGQQALLMALRHIALPCPGAARQPDGQDASCHRQRFRSASLRGKAAWMKP